MEPEKPIENNLTPKKRIRINWKIVGISLGVILTISLLLIIYQRYFLGARALTESGSGGLKFNLKPILEKKKIASPLNGEMVNEDLANQYPLAVMIENHPDARPQSGLSQANIVYEAITEGGITRFMAIFGSKPAKEVGPVRSARTFYLDWASEYGAYYAHAGGAPDALSLIPKSNVYDLPHTQGYFERKARGNVDSEHTLFTSTESLYRLASAKKYPVNTNFEKLEYKDDSKVEERGVAKTISINFSSDSYLVAWSYDTDKNSYTRGLAGSLHKDSINNEPIAAKVIIVQEVLRQPIQLPGAKPTFKFTTTGSGKATVYQDGKEINGTWKKADQKSRTKFYDQDGTEIKFNRGTSWYEIVPPETSVTVK